MAELRYEDPAFKTEFDDWTHAGAPAELVALVSPLVRGDERGGTPQGRKDAEAFLHKQSLGGLMREPFEQAESYNVAMQLLAKHGAKIDRAVMDRFARTTPPWTRP